MKGNKIIELPDIVTWDWINEQLDEFNKTDNIGAIKLGWGAYKKIMFILGKEDKGHFFINGIYTERKKDLKQNEMEISLFE